ncbi:hypothetical protein EJ04DRAFT_227440 [Polyplosphaeria fusca]|uniref:Ubiquitin-like domain-containing protein n=1 Tax=Polyplosphaeria fusca TaxID=682080 RepID=A0A9P4QXZ0_9PLEO|nr:hypothetical protein EJ04DRAFT_227440 [Polyplosphaeria fusca]
MKTLHNKALLRIGDEHATTRHEVIRETALIIKNEHVRTRNILQEILLILQHVLAPLTILVILTLRLCVSSQQIYNVLLEMRSARLLDTRWTFFQAPYVFKDALGRVYPIPSEFDFDLIRTIIKGRFWQKPGYRQVLLADYELLTTRDTRQVISANTYLWPDATISMAIVLNTPSTGTDCCPISGCRSTRCENRQEGGKLCLQCLV